MQAKTVASLLFQNFPNAPILISGQPDGIGVNIKQQYFDLPLHFKVAFRTGVRHMVVDRIAVNHHTGRVFFARSNTDIPHRLQVVGSPHANRIPDP